MKPRAIKTRKNKVRVIKVVDEMEAEETEIFTSPKKHISVSQLTTYNRCCRQWYYRYVKGLKSPPSIPLIVGSRAHDAIEYNFKKKLKTKKDLSEVKIVKFLKSNWANKMKKDISMIKSAPSDLRFARKQVEGCVDIFRRKIAPKIMPTMVEQKIEVAIEGITVLGYIDTVTKPALWDWKTSKSKFRIDAASRSIQLAIYCLMLKIAKGIRRTNVGIGVMLKQVTPKEQILPGLIEQPEINRAVNMLIQTQKGIKAGVFPPCCDDRTCSWCGYREECDNELGKKIYIV